MFYESLSKLQITFMKICFLFITNETCESGVLDYAFNQPLQVTVATSGLKFRFIFPEIAAAK